MSVQLKFLILGKMKEMAVSNQSDLYRRFSVYGSPLKKIATILSYDKTVSPGTR